MKKRTIYVFAILAMLSSCSSNSDSSNGQPQVSLSVTEAINRDVMTYYYLGEEARAELEEIKSDRSAPADMLNKAKQNWQAIQDMDKVLLNSIKLIEALKVSVLKSAGCDNTLIEKGSSYNNINRYDLLTLKSKTNATTEIDLTKKQELISQLYEMRTAVVKLMVESASNSKLKYTFNDPEFKASEFSDYETFSSKLRSHIEQSNVSIDDHEILVKIYTVITLCILDSENNIVGNDNILNAFSNLTNIEKQVLDARHLLFSNLRSRIGGSNYLFTEVAPIITGPVTVKKGRSINLNVTYGGYNSYGNPMVEANGGTPNGAIHGSGIVVVKGDKIGLKTVSGTITVLNKSGEPRTIEWTREIYVTE